MPTKFISRLSNSAIALCHLPAGRMVGKTLLAVALLYKKLQSNHWTAKKTLYV
jgi:hypothetical protein